jgi:hypothetical protein
MVTTGTTNIIPSEVRDYMRQSNVISVLYIDDIGWQKSYDEAIAQEKSQSPTTTIFVPQSNASGQQGWNTVGGKPAQKANPWGSQHNRKSPSSQRTLEI